MCRSRIRHEQSTNAGFSPRYTPIRRFIGEAGNCVGSRLRGHPKRGGKWLRERHRRYATVIMTDEYRSSQTYPFCYGPISHPKVRNDRVCPLYNEGACLQNRNAMIATRICLTGASKVLHGETIAPLSKQTVIKKLYNFKHHRRHPTNLRCSFGPLYKEGIANFEVAECTFFGQGDASQIKTLIARCGWLFHPYSFFHV